MFGNLTSHGATVAFSVLNCLRNENFDHDTAGVNVMSLTPASRSAARTARFPVTSAIVQLNAKRAAPQYERNNRS